MTLPVRAFALVRSLPHRSLIDRLVRGRAWIPVLGVLLAGIVAMQVEILKLGTSMGRWLERTATLQSHNGSLQASVAALSDDQRIERLAEGMGMLMPSPSSLTFLHGQGPNRLGRALAGIHAPDPATFAAQVATQLAAAAMIAPSTTTASAGGGSPSQTAAGAPVLGAGAGSSTGASGSPTSGSPTTASPTTASPTTSVAASPAAGTTTSSTTSVAAPPAPGTTTSSASTTASSGAAGLVSSSQGAPPGG